MFHGFHPRALLRGQNLSEASPQPHSSSEAAEDPPSWSGNSPGKPQRRCWWMKLFLSHTRMLHVWNIYQHLPHK